MGGQTLPFEPCSFRSDPLQPVSQRIAWAVFQPPWAWYIQAWYMLEAPGAVLTALLCKIFLQNCFFWLSFGKTCVDSAQDELFLLSVCVGFCSSCKLQKGISRAFPDLWKAVKLKRVTCAWQTAGATASDTTASLWQQFIFHTSDAGPAQLTQSHCPGGL